MDELAVLAKQSPPCSVGMFIPEMKDRKLFADRLLNTLDTVFPTSVLSYRCDPQGISVSIFGDPKLPARKIHDELEIELVSYIQEMINEHNQESSGNGVAVETAVSSSGVSTNTADGTQASSDSVVPG